MPPFITVIEATINRAPLVKGPRQKGNEQGDGWKKTYSKYLLEKTERLNVEHDRRLPDENKKEESLRSQNKRRTGRECKKKRKRKERL